MQYLYTINLLVFLLLSFIWTSNNWKNLFIKLALCLLCFANAFVALQFFGYLVKIGA